jgi:hypothetical protein
VSGSQAVREKAGAFQNGADRIFCIQNGPRASLFGQPTNVFISLLIRRHLYTNESRSADHFQFVGRAPPKKSGVDAG